MKLRRVPEDFVVEELTDVRPGDGAHALYRLTKRSVTTLDAVDTVRKAWKVDRRRLSYGGLKDRHAVTRQHLTIAHGPERDFTASHFKLEYLGKTMHPFSAEDIRANRFRLTLRDMSVREIEAAEAAAGAAALTGVPNYFDDQRFGSLGKSMRFIAVPWCRGDFEEALRLALAEPNAHDRPNEKKEKETLRRHWGDWVRLKADLARSQRRSIITHLADHPGDFQGAFERIDADLRGLFRSAFQSAVWNRMLGTLIRRAVPEGERFEVSLLSGKAAFFKRLDDAARERLSAAELPFPSAKAVFADDLTRAVAADAARSFGLELEEMKLPASAEDYFSKGSRAALLFPREFSSAAKADEMHPGRKKLEVAFELPRGAYATMIVKRLTEEP